MNAVFCQSCEFYESPDRVGDKCPECGGKLGAYELRYQVVSDRISGGNKSVRYDGSHASPSKKPAPPNQTKPQGGR